MHCRYIRFNTAATVMLCLVTAMGCQLTDHSQGVMPKLWSSDKKTVTAAEESRGQWVYLTNGNAARGNELTVSAPTQQLATDVGAQTPELQVQQAAAYLGESIPLTYLGSSKISTMANLLEAFDWQTAKPYQVDFALRDLAGGANNLAVEVDGVVLSRWIHSMHTDRECIRFNKAECPWYFMRDQEMQCRLCARTLPTRGLIQIAFEFQSVGMQPRICPNDVQLHIDGLPARCLSANEVMSRLYDYQKDQPSSDPGPRGWRELVQNESFAVPSNYESLATLNRENPGGWLLPTNGTEYPGGGVLGDARALGGFMLEQSMVGPHEPKSGWVFFGYDPTKKANEIALTIDMGSRPITIPLQRL